MPHITKLDVENIKSIVKQSFKFGPGVNIIVGENHTGKTSAVQVVKNLFEGGACYELVAHGKNNASGRIEWSDGAYALKEVTLATAEDKKDRYTVDVYGPNGELKSRSAEFINGRVPKSSFGVEEFLRLDPKKRADFLIRNVDISFEAEEVNACLRTKVGKLVPKEDFYPPVEMAVDLGGFNEIRDTIYAKRTEVNRVKDETQATISSLQESLPNEQGTDWGAERIRLQRDLTQVVADIASSEAGIKLEAEAARVKAREARTQQRDAARPKIASFVALCVNLPDIVNRYAVAGGLEAADPAAQVDRIVYGLVEFKTVVASLAMVEADFSDYMEKIDRMEMESIQADAKTLHEKKAELTGALAEAQQKSEADQRAGTIKGLIAENEEKSRGLVTKAMFLTAILEALDKARNEKLKALPISGFDLRYDKNKRPIITINGTELEHLSGQEAVFLAIQCIQFAQGECPLVLMESISAELTKTYLYQLAEICAQSEPPVQIIAARPMSPDEIETAKKDKRLKLTPAGDSLYVMQVLSKAA